MRVLITGSRDWRNADLIAARLGSLLHHASPAEFVVVHGDCPRGADAMARRWAEDVAGEPNPRPGVSHEPHPADWDGPCRPECTHRGRPRRRDGVEYCPAAGNYRNADMVVAGADVCLAFIRDRSPGATNCARLALDAGIELHVWRETA
jgi:hypothetical protein